jgi:HAD superfamily hydrolase (TIGR01484 family)
MKPFAQLSDHDLRGVRVVLTDVDGTLTTGPHVRASTYSAIERLTEAGLMVVPITGGPAGMCMTMARMWPVAAVVGESGAFYFRAIPSRKQLLKRFWFNAAERQAHRQIRERAWAEILTACPEARLAADQAYRENDLAIDCAEDGEPLAAQSVAQIKTILLRNGLNAHQSSIHINAWMGNYTKLAMTKVLMQEQFNLDIEAQTHECLFIGDAPNDSTMFRFFPLSIGVANILQYQLPEADQPRYITPAAYGAGFEQMAQRLLDLRQKNGAGT